MPTFQLTIETNHNLASDFEQCLFDLGCLSISYTDAKDQPIFEPELGTTPLWNEIKLLALFEENQNIDTLLSYFSKHNLNLEKQAISIEPLPERDWIRAWMDDYKPMQYSDNFWVVPHEMTPPDPNAINLRLDPGLAFGTGTHSTTRLCLEWISQNDFNGKTVVDFGCGSGILAIAACLCGAEKVYCTDIDQQALEATLANAIDNSVKDKIELYLPEDMPPIKADIVLANILAGPLCELKETISDLAKSSATLILSGILEEQKDQVTQCYLPFFDTITSAQHEDWIRLVANR